MTSAINLRQQFINENILDSKLINNNDVFNLTLNISS